MKPLKVEDSTVKLFGDSKFSKTRTHKEKKTRQKGEREEIIWPVLTKLGILYEISCFLEMI